MGVTGSAAYSVAVAMPATMAAAVAAAVSDGATGGAGAGLSLHESPYMSVTEHACELYSSFSTHRQPCNYPNYNGLPQAVPTP